MIRLRKSCEECQTAFEVYPAFVNARFCSRTCKGQAIAGDRAIMRRPEIRARATVTLKATLATEESIKRHSDGQILSYKNKPERIEAQSRRTKQQHLDGKLLGKAGKNSGGNRCPWYTVTLNGKTYKCQGRYELAFLKFLVEQQLDFRCHDDLSIHYFDGVKKRVYFADFWVSSWNAYVDVKSQFTLRESEQKLALVTQQIAPVKLLIFAESDFASANIDISPRALRTLVDELKATRNSHFNT